MMNAPTSAPTSTPSSASIASPARRGDAIGAFLEQDYAAGFETTLDTDTAAQVGGLIVSQ